MKQTLNSLPARFIILSIVFYTLFSCKETKTKEDKSQTTDSTMIDKKGDPGPGNPEIDIKEQLANLTPLGAEELKALLPSSLQGAEQENADFSSSTGAATVNAEFKINDSVKVQLTLVDCAGPAGSGFFATQWLDRINAGSGTADSKIIEFKGGKAIQESPADSQERSITWFGGNRYLLTLFGEKIEPGELKKIAEGIEIR